MLVGTYDFVPKLQHVFDGLFLRYVIPHASKTNKNIEASMEYRSESTVCPKGFLIIDSNVS